LNGGTVSGTYTFANLPFTIGKLATCPVNALQRNNIYFISEFGYDHSGNESQFSAKTNIGNFSMQRA
jgi:hypothetical protein